MADVRLEYQLDGIRICFKALETGVQMGQDATTTIKMQKPKSVKSGVSAE